MERAELEQRLTCAECRTTSDEHAIGWRAFLGCGVGELEVVILCGVCAEFEFGCSR